MRYCEFWLFMNGVSIVATWLAKQLAILPVVALLVVTYLMLPRRILLSQSWVYFYYWPVFGCSHL
jgi:hypothetical protein